MTMGHVYVDATSTKGRSHCAHSWPVVVLRGVSDGASCVGRYDGTCAAANTSWLLSGADYLLIRCAANPAVQGRVKSAGGESRPCFVQSQLVDCQ